jgi:hypothetical protein
MTHRLFIDEIGNSDLDGAALDPNIRFLALTGVIAIRDHHERILRPRIEGLKGVFPSHSTDDPVVLHRRDIMRREGRFNTLRDDGVKAAFDAELLDLIDKCPYLAITVQIDKKAHLETYSVWRFDPYHYCLRCLIERYALYLKRHQVQGDVVIEPRYKKADKKVKTSFERIYREGTENIPAPMMQAHLLSKDIGFFEKKHNVAGLQLADILAHPSARYMRFQRDGIPQPDDFGSRIAQILVDKHYVRNPHTRCIEGYGTKWLP